MIDRHGIAGVIRVIPVSPGQATGFLADRPALFLFILCFGLARCSSTAVDDIQATGCCDPAGILDLAGPDILARNYHFIDPYQGACGMASLGFGFYCLMS